MQKQMFNGRVTVGTDGTPADLPIFFYVGLASKLLFVWDIQSLGAEF